MIIVRVLIAGELEKLPGEQHEVPGDGQPMCGPATDGDRRALCQIRSALGIEFDSTPLYALDAGPWRLGFNACVNYNKSCCASISSVPDSDSPQRG
jgi:hypothetical protein